MERGECPLSEEELARPAAILVQRFIQRWDVYPLQLEDGRYVCIHKQLNVGHLYAHLRGEITLGAYLLNRESKVRFVVLDNDAEDGWNYLLKCGEKLASHDIPVYLEKSRRGGHLWIFFERPVDGSVARAFSRDVEKKYQFKGFELYPKQDNIGRGFGSLIRMPFGLHRLSGRRYGFFEGNGHSLGSTLREQIYALQRPHFVSEVTLEPYKVISSVPTTDALPKRLHESKGYVSERLKSRITVLEFISQYVDLKPTESGAVGLCPFHDDKRSSFGVNDKENYWHCFAGCGGGSIIDFWSLWRKKEGLDPGFVPTITELAEIIF